MPITVYIPTPFRRLTGNRSLVEVRGSNVNEALTDLETRFPGIGDLIFDGERQIPNHVNIYLNSREIHSLDGQATTVSDGDELAVIPAIAGGNADCSIQRSRLQLGPAGRPTRAATLATPPTALGIPYSVGRNQ